MNIAGSQAEHDDDDLRQACKSAGLLYLARVLFAAQRPAGELQSKTLGLPISKIIAASGIK